MAFNAGWAFGPAVAGLLAGRGYFWLFAGDAATSALFGLVAFFALPIAVRGARDESSWGEALRAIGRSRQFHRVLIAMMAMGLVFFQTFSTFGLHVVHLGFSSQMYGLVLSLNGVLIVLCELPLTTFTRRFPARTMMATGYVLGGVGFALNAFAHSVAALAGCMVIFTLGEMVAMPVTSAYVADLAPAHMRGRFMGVYGLVWAVALTIGPGIGMKLYALGPTSFLLGCGSLGLLAALVISGGGKTPAAIDPIQNSFADGVEGGNQSVS
jgi:MFS family permease